MKGYSEYWNLIERSVPPPCPLLWIANEVNKATWGQLAAVTASDAMNFCAKSHYPGKIDILISRS